MSIEDLTKIQLEELQGAEEIEARDEYALDVEFASLQLRAQALLSDAWAAYRQQVEVERALSAVYEKHRPILGLKAGLAIFADVRETCARTCALFQVWSVLSDLARAQGRDDIEVGRKADALAVLAQMEEVEVEKLLSRQAATRATTAMRQEDEI